MPIELRIVLPIELPIVLPIVLPTIPYCIAGRNQAGPSWFRPGLGAGVTGGGPWPLGFLAIHGPWSSGPWSIVHSPRSRVRSDSKRNE